jgi:hypothetical protein
LPGVTIIVTHQESGTVRETITSADGGYLVPGLVPGPYRITAELQGFRRLIQSDVVLRIGTTMQVDLLMQVGGLEESVTVTAEILEIDGNKIRYAVSAINDAGVKIGEGKHRRAVIRPKKFAAG